MMRMPDRSFDGPLDQAAHQVEKTLFAAAAFADSWVVLDHVIQPTGVGAVMRMLVFPFIVLSVMGALAYVEATYRLGRIHWLPRVLLDAAVLVFFYAMVVAPLRR